MSNAKYIVTWGRQYYPPEGLNPKNSEIFTDSGLARDFYNRKKSDLGPLDWIQMSKITDTVSVVQAHKINSDNDIKEVE